jgi:hypothetical protein
LKGVVGLWKKLIEKYEGVDPMRMITMLKSLVNLEPVHGADPSIFFSQLEELRDSIETWYQGLLKLGEPDNPSGAANGGVLTRGSTACPGGSAGAATAPATATAPVEPPKLLNDLFLIGLVLGGLGGEIRHGYLSHEPLLHGKRYHLYQAGSNPRPHRSKVQMGFPN